MLLSIVILRKITSATFSASGLMFPQTTSLGSPVDKSDLRLGVDAQLNSNCRFSKFNQNYRHRQPSYYSIIPSPLMPLNIFHSFYIILPFCLMNILHLFPDSYSYSIILFSPNIRVPTLSVTQQLEPLYSNQIYFLHLSFFINAPHSFQILESFFKYHLS